MKNKINTEHQNLSDVIKIPSDDTLKELNLVIESKDFDSAFHFLKSLLVSEYFDSAILLLESLPSMNDKLLGELPQELVDDFFFDSAITGSPDLIKKLLELVSREVIDNFLSNVVIQDKSSFGNKVDEDFFSNKLPVIIEQVISRASPQAITEALLDCKDPEIKALLLSKESKHNDMVEKLLLGNSSTTGYNYSDLGQVEFKNESTAIIIKNLSLKDSMIINNNSELDRYSELSDVESESESVEYVENFSKEEDTQEISLNGVEAYTL